MRGSLFLVVLVVGLVFATLGAQVGAEERQAELPTSNESDDSLGIPQVAWDFWDKEDFESAAPYFAAAVERNPNNARAHMLLGHVYDELDNGAAISEFQTG